MASSGLSFFGFFRSIITVCMAMAMSVGALCVATFPATAGPPSPEFSLAFDRVQHALDLNGVDPDPASALAFRDRALQHDLFLGDGFTFWRSAARL